MGLWAWGFFSQICTPKFWRSVKREGYIMTYQRAHKAVRNTHGIAGVSEFAKFVGMDEFGNKYYEDFGAHYLHTQRRWVEYNCYTGVRDPMGDKIPPKWHGWLHHVYDDVPLPGSTSFHEPFFGLSHNWNYGDDFFNLYLPGECIGSPNYGEYNQKRKNRYSESWEAITLRE